MAKLTRVLQKIFASTATAGEIGKIGSLAAGTPITTTDPLVMQALSNYLDGWFACILGVNSPAIEDMNALFFLITRQIAYLMQEGVPEWDATTTYFIGSLVNSGGTLFVSLTDNNIGNALTSTANWSTQSGAIKAKTAAYTVLATDGMIKGDTTAGGFALTLPSAATTLGRRFRIIQTGDTENPLKIQSTDLINGEASQDLVGSMASVIVESDGSTYFVF